MNKNKNKNLYERAVEYSEIFSNIHKQLSDCELTLREMRNQFIFDNPELTLREMRNQFIFDNQLCEEFRNSYNNIVRARDHMITLFIHTDFIKERECNN